MNIELDNGTIVEIYVKDNVNAFEEVLLYLSVRHQTTPSVIASKLPLLAIVDDSNWLSITNIRSNVYDYLSKLRTSMANLGQVLPSPPADSILIPFDLKLDVHGIVTIENLIEHVLSKYQLESSISGYMGNVYTRRENLIIANILSVLNFHYTGSYFYQFAIQEILEKDFSTASELLQHLQEEKDPYVRRIFTEVLLVKYPQYFHALAPLITKEDPREIDDTEIVV